MLDWRQGLLRFINRRAASAGLFVMPLHRWKRAEALVRSLAQELARVSDRPTSLPMAGIVFSKDRPLQLHALLESYRDLVSNPAPLTVLFRASDEGYRAGYAEVAQANRDVAFVEEDNFRADLIGLMDRLDARAMFFLVDDIVFTRPVDLVDYGAADLALFVPALRLGPNVRRSYTRDRATPTPQFTPLGEAKLRWRWSEGINDFGYPLSVDGNLFATDEMAVMVKTVAYRSPNTFEDALQAFMPLYRDREGICYSHSCIVNIPINKVQNDNANRSGELEVSWFLEQWRKGLKLDVRRLYGFENISPHQEVELGFVPRGAD